MPHAQISASRAHDAHQCLRRHRVHSLQKPDRRCKWDKTNGFLVECPSCHGYAPDWIQATAFIIVFLAPLIINMALLVRHQIDLDRHPIAVRAA